MKYAKDQLEDSIRSGTSQSLLDMMKDDGQAVVGNLMSLVSSTGDAELAKSFERPEFRESFLRWLSQDHNLEQDPASTTTTVGTSSTILVDGADQHQKQERNKSNKKEQKAAAGKKYQPSLANPNAAVVPSVHSVAQAAANLGAAGGGTATTNPASVGSKGMAAKAPTTKQNTTAAKRNGGKPTAKREDSTSSGITETTPVTDNVNHGRNTKDISPALSEATKKISNRIKDKRLSDDEGEQFEIEPPLNKTPLQPGAKPAMGAPRFARFVSGEMPAVHDEEIQQPPGGLAPPGAEGAALMGYDDGEALSFAIQCFLAQHSQSLARPVPNPDQLEPSFHTAASSSLISMSESTFSSGALSQAIEHHLQSKVQKAGLNLPTVPDSPIAVTASPAAAPAGAMMEPQQTMNVHNHHEQKQMDDTTEPSLHHSSSGLMSIPSAPSESVVRMAVGLDDPTEASGALTAAGGQSLPPLEKHHQQPQNELPQAVPPVQKISIPSPSTERDLNPLTTNVPAPPPSDVSQMMVDPPSLAPEPIDGYNATSMPPPPGETPQDALRPTLLQMASLYEQQQAMLAARHGAPPSPYHPTHAMNDPRNQLRLSPGYAASILPVDIQPLPHEEVSVHSDITGLTGMESRPTMTFPRGRGMEVAVNPSFRMRKSYSIRHMTEEEKAIVRSPYIDVAGSTDGLSGASSAEPELLHHNGGAAVTRGNVNVNIRSPYPRDDYIGNDDSSTSSSSSSDDSDASDFERDEFDKRDVMVIAAGDEIPGGQRLTQVPRYGVPQSVPPAAMNMTGYVGQHSRDNLRVRFGNVTVREYDRILGDNPSCTSGPALGIGWRVAREREMELTDFAPQERYGAIDHALTLDRKEREFILLELGYTKKEIAQSVRALTKSRNQRRQTVGNLRNERIEYAMEKAKLRLIRILTVKKQQESAENGASETVTLPSAPSASNKAFQNIHQQQSTNTNSSMRSLPPF